MVDKKIIYWFLRVEISRAVRKARKPRNAHRKLSSVSVKRIAARIEKRLYKLGLYNPLLTKVDEKECVINVDVYMYVPAAQERIEFKAVIA